MDCALTYVLIIPMMLLRQNEFKVKSYAGWSRNPEVTHTCSSGGIGYELAKHLVENGYKACCARYNAKKRYSRTLYLQIQL